MAISKTTAYLTILLAACLTASATNSLRANVVMAMGGNFATVYVGDYTSRFDCNITQNVTGVATFALNESLADPDVLNRTIRETCGDRIRDMNASFSRLLDKCETILNNYDEVYNYYDPYVDCVSNLTYSRDRVEALSEAEKEAEKCATDLDTCKKDLDSSNANLATTTTQLSTMTEQRDQCNKEKSSQNTYLWLAIIIGGAGWLYIGKQYWDKKSKEPRLPSQKNQPTMDFPGGG